MKKRKVTSGNLHNTNSSYSIMVWILFALFAVLFLFSPYQRGLFFHTDFFNISLAMQALFLSSLVTLFPIVREQVQRQWKLFLFLFAIPLAYTIAFWYSYVPSTGAYTALQWFSYVLLFWLLLVWMAVEARIKKWLWFLAWGTMLWITYLVFFVNFQIVEFRDAILGWGRFSSVFQYPNTFAALLSVFIIVALVNLTKRLNKVHTYLYAFTLFPFFLAFLLTQSRGALLVFIAVWVLAMFFLSWKEQGVYVGYSLLLFLGGFWGYSKYTGWMQEELLGRSAALVVVLTLLGGILLAFVQYRFIQSQSLAGISRWNLLAPSLLTVIGGLSVLLAGSTVRDKLVQLFPEGLQRRIASISLDEAYSRLLFFKDAFVVWKDHFWLGTGGGGWRALFESYKSLPYYSTQAHSFYMQTLVEVGLLGSLVLFGFFFYVVGKGIWFYFRQQSRSEVESELNLQQESTLLSSVIIGAVILLMHSAIDFNMSFGTYNFFLFLFLAIIWNLVQDKPLLSKRFGSLFQRLQERVSERGKLLATYSFIGGLTLCSLFAAYTSYAYNQAEQVQGQLQQGGEFQVLIGHVDRAISYNVHDVRFRQLKLNVLHHAYQQMGDTQLLEQMKTEYEQILAKEPMNYQHYLHFAQFLWDIGEKDKSMELKLQALDVAPWQQSIYEDIVSSGLIYVREIESEGQVDTALLEQLEQVMQKYEQKLVQQVEESPEGLTLTARIKRNYDQQLNMGQLYLYQEKYTAALAVLREYFPESWLEQEWYLNLFIDGTESEEVQVKPFSLQMLQDDLQRYLVEGHVIILAGEGASSRHLSQPVKDLLLGTGSTISNIGVYDSYLGVIVDGKIMVEEISGEGPVEITNKIHPELSQALAGQAFTFYSAGHELGNDSAIIWQGEDYKLNGSGLTIVVLDKNLQVVERVKYNTHYWDYKIVLEDEKS